jgi:hypothetical protein
VGVNALSAPPPTNQAHSMTMPTLTINIKRQYFAQILAIPRRKSIEYRDMSAYWLTRLAKVGSAPFRMRMLNGMAPPVPEATVIVTKVVLARQRRQIHLHLGRVIHTENWDRRKEVPMT